MGFLSFRKLTQKGWISGFEKKTEEAKHYKFLYEDLAATITYPPLVLVALDWLKTALLVEPLEDLSIETNDAGRVIEMDDQAFESLVTNFGSLTSIRYALRKQELKKEGQELYTMVKGTSGFALPTHYLLDVCRNLLRHPNSQQWGTTTKPFCTSLLFRVGKTTFYELLRGNGNNRNDEGDNQEQQF